MKYVHTMTSGMAFLAPKGDRYFTDPAHIEKMHVQEVRDVEALLREHVGKKDKDWVFYDVGACIGVSCIPAIKLGLFKKAVAFEPQAENYRLLRANIELNDVPGNIFTHPAAVGAKLCYAAIEAESASNCGSFYLRPTDGKNPQRIPVLPLRDYRIPGAGLVWVDAQGSEADVLVGSGEEFSDLPWYLEIEIPCLKRSGAMSRMVALVKSRFTHFIDMRSDRKPQPIEKFDSIYDVIQKRGQKMTNCLFWKEV